MPKITDLPELLNPTDDDVLPIDDSPASNAATKKITRGNLVKGLATKAELDGHTDDVDNPHQTSKDQVGLSNVPNADATQRTNHTGTQAISTVSGLQTALDGKSPTSHTQPASTITDFDISVSNNTDVSANTTNRHAHSNKALLDTYDQSNADLTDAVGKKHSHSNKALLDTYTQTEADIADAIAKEHTHSNKATLDASTASYTSGKDSKLSGIQDGATVNDTDANLKNRANHTGYQPSSTISDFNTAADARISAQKGQNNGLATLDGSGKVPSLQLPSFVDDVLEFANIAAFPATGSTGVIYAALDTNRVYRWGGSAYTEISPSPGSTDAVPEGSTNKYFSDALVEANTEVAANTATRHSHSNKALLDTYDQTNSNLADAVTKKHAHANQAVLDAASASFLTADETKLDGVATGATANDTDANLKNRANHTGTQTGSTISDFQTTVSANTNVAASVTHAARTDNPHAVTKSQVGLANADNTADTAKPISTATQTALDAKAADASVVHLAGSETVTGVKTFNAGTFLDKGNQVINVKAFGATGDGLTNDRTAIQNAINSITAGQSGTIYLPEGTYIFGSAINFGTRKVRLLGAGQNRTILKVSSSFSGFALIYDYTTGLSDISLEDITLDSNSVDGKGIIEFGVCANITIHNCEFRNVASPSTSHWTVKIGSINNADIAGSASTNIVFTHNYVHDNANGTNETVLPINVRNSRFDDNYFLNNSNTAYTLNLFGYCYNSTVVGNIFRNSVNNIYVLSSEGVIVSNNASYCDGFGQNFLVVSNSHNVAINGNLVHGYRTGGSATGGIYIYDRAGTFDGHAQLHSYSRFISIAGNQLYDPYYGIQIATGTGIFNAYQAEDIHITGNQIFSAEYQPILVGKNDASVSIQNITIENNYLGISNMFDHGAIAIVGDSTTPDINKVKNITIRNNKILPSARPNAAGIELNACSAVAIIGNDLTGTGKGTLASQAIYTLNGATTSQVFNNLGWNATLPSNITLVDAAAGTKGVLQLAGDLGGTAASPTVPGLAGKEPVIGSGTTSQYWRGDKSWQALDKAAVGLPYADNTSDSAKPVSTATQTALDGKVDKNAAISGATKTKITYDSKGLVTAGADATQDDIGDGTTYKQYSTTDKTKLAGIATGATANDTDANLKDRANHTGSQAISSVTSLQIALDAKAADSAVVHLSGAETVSGAKTHTAQLNIGTGGITPYVLWGDSFRIQGSNGSANLQIANTSAGKAIRIISQGNVCFAYFDQDSKSLGINTGFTAANSILQVVGPIATALVTKTTTYTITATDSVILADATSAAFTVTLPSAVGCTGRQYTIKRINSAANNVTVATTSAQTIDGASTKTLGAQWSAVTVVSDGANWQIVNMVGTVT